MKNPPPPALDEEPRKGILGEIWKFMTRDVRTFKWWQQSKTDPKTYDLTLPDFKTPPDSAPEIISEVDPRQIEVLRLRREVLNWRDEFHFQVTETASQAKKMLEQQVEQELADMNFLRLWLFTKPTIKVLEGHIESCVRSAMIRTTQIEEAALRQRLLERVIDLLPAPPRRETPQPWAP